MVCGIWLNFFNLIWVLVNGGLPVAIWEQSESLPESQSLNFPAKFGSDLGLEGVPRLTGSPPVDI